MWHHFVVFKVSLSLCHPTWPGTYYTEQAGLEHRELAQVLRLTEESPHPIIASLGVFFLNYISFMHFGDGVGHACQSTHVEVIKQPIKVGVFKSSGWESSTLSAEPLSSSQCPNLKNKYNVEVTTIIPSSRKYITTRQKELWLFPLKLINNLCLILDLFPRWFQHFHP